MASRPLRRLLRAAPLLLLGACSLIGIDGPMTSLEPQGPFSEQINDLFWPVFWTAVVVFVLVEGAIVAASFLFRDRPGRKEPKQVHGNTKLEVIWTAIPVIILASIAVPTVRGIFDLTECGSGAMPVEIYGHQWWFEYRYPENGAITGNVLVIPAGREVCATMTSEDVIHNYWVPALNGKRYLVPGHTTYLRLQADEPGEYWGQCGEFCGLSHSLMRARVVALPEAEFQSWLAKQLEPAAEPDEGSEAAAGLALFQQKGCIQCHTARPWNTVANQNFNGPDLTHLMERDVIAGAAFDNTPEDLKNWLANPPLEKPGSYMPNLGLTEQEIDSIIAWLETLK